MKIAALLAVAAAVGSAAPLLGVTGAPKPVALIAADLADITRGAAALAAHGAMQNCEGVWLRDVLARAAVPAGEAVQGPALTTTVLAQARDGYLMLFSLGEIDAALGNGRLLVADRCDGKPLPDEHGGLRIVAEGEKRGARAGAAGDDAGGCGHIVTLCVDTRGIIPYRPAFASVRLSSLAALMI